MPEINLPTAGKQDTILANTNAININVETNKSTLATVNANLGTPTSGASNATGSNAHAKLNYINSMLGTINNNVNAGNRHAGVYKTGPSLINPQSRTHLDVRGKGVLRTAVSGSQGIEIIIDGTSVFGGGQNSGIVNANYPFNSSLQIRGSATENYDLRWLYELY